MLSQFFSHPLSALNPVSDNLWGEAGLVLQEAKIEQNNLHLTHPYHNIKDAGVPFKKDVRASFTHVNGLGSLVHFEDGSALVAAYQNTDKPWHGKNEWKIFPWVFYPTAAALDELETLLLTQDEWPQIAQDPTETEKMPPIWKDWVAHPRTDLAMALGALKYLGHHSETEVSLTGHTFFENQAKPRTLAEHDIRDLLKSFDFNTSFVCQKPRLQVQDTTPVIVLKPDTLIVWYQGMCPFQSASQHQKLKVIEHLQQLKQDHSHANTLAQ